MRLRWILLMLAFLLGWFHGPRAARGQNTIPIVRIDGVPWVDFDGAGFYQNWDDTTGFWPTCVLIIDTTLVIDSQMVPRQDTQTVGSTEKVAWWDASGGPATSPADVRHMIDSALAVRDCWYCSNPDKHDVMCISHSPTSADWSPCPDNIFGCLVIHPTPAEPCLAVDTVWTCLEVMNYNEAIFRRRIDSSYTEGPCPK